MTVRRWDKLVRDRIPAILAEQGIEATIRVLDETEYMAALKDKLLEEAREVRQEDDRRDLAAELADVIEAAYALGATIGLSRTALEEVRQTRARERGGFAARIFLEYTEDAKG